MALKDIMIVDPFLELYEYFDENRIINYFVDRLKGDGLSYVMAVEYTLDYFRELKRVGKFGLF